MNRFRPALLLSLAGCLATLALAAEPPVASHAAMKAAPKHSCLRIGHRGAASLAPENTLAAVRAAAAAGVDGCEFDVRRTADGACVIIHDDNLKRTTNGGNVKLASATLAQVRALDAGRWGDWKKDGRFAGEKLPTLDEMIGEIVKHGVAPVVELKVGGIEEAVADGLKRHHAVDKAWIIAFDYASLEVFADRYPEYRLAWLVDKQSFQDMDAADVVRSATLIKCQALNAQFETITPALVKAVHDAGMAMLAWTVDKPEDMRRLIDMGVDGITTNRPQDLNVVLNKAR